MSVISCPSVHHWLMMSISTAWDWILSFSFMSKFSFFTGLSVLVINTSSQLVITVKSPLVSSASASVITHRFLWPSPSPSGFCSCLFPETGAVRTPLWETTGRRGRSFWGEPGAGRMFPEAWKARGVCGRNAKKWTSKRCSCRCTLQSLTSHLSWLDKTLCAWARWPARTWQNRRHPWRRSVFPAQRRAASETCAEHRRWSGATETGKFPRDTPLSASVGTPRRRRRRA